MGLGAAEGEFPLGEGGGVVVVWVGFSVVGAAAAYF